MKFCLILIGLLGINFINAQEVDEYYEAPKNRKVIEVGANYFIPQGDFSRKSPDNHLGVDFSLFRQINFSRFFIGFNYSSRRLDEETVRDFEPNLDIQARTRNLNYSIAGRMYPQLYLSIFEFFADAGVGMNLIRTISRDYDKLTSEYFNQQTLQSDWKVIFYGGGGFHIPLDDSWFITTKVHTFYGPSTEFYKRREGASNIVFPLDAFELTSAAYQATTISVSLTFIF